MPFGGLLDHELLPVDRFAMIQAPDKRISPMKKKVARSTCRSVRRKWMHARQRPLTVVSRCEQNLLETMHEPKRIAIAQTNITFAARPTPNHTYQICMWYFRRGIPMQWMCVSLGSEPIAISTIFTTPEKVDWLLIKIDDDVTWIYVCLCVH